MVENHQNSLLGKIAAYTEILAADPRSTIFVSLSESYRKMGMLDEAHSVALKGLAHLPDYGPGHVVFARIQCQQGDMAESATSFRKALDIDPDSLAALVGFSRLCILLGNTIEARNLLLTARELSPADAVINKLLLSLPEIVEEPEPELSHELSEPEASSVAQVEPLETATLADLYLKQGMADRALDIYRNLLLRDPDNLEFRRRIRDIELMTVETIEVKDIVPGLSDQVETDLISALPIDHSSAVSPNLQPSSSVEKLSVLDQLNCLLTSIQKRRGDV